jgi:hypothetical protein
LISQRPIPAPNIEILHIKRYNNENKVERDLGKRAQIPIEISLLKVGIDEFRHILGCK